MVTVKRHDSRSVVIRWSPATRLANLFGLRKQTVHVPTNDFIAWTSFFL
jgi:hypothetical protein